VTAFPPEDLKRLPRRPRIMDEDSPKWPGVPQSHIEWNSQYRSESPGLEVAGCEWRCALLMVQARSDDDDDDDDAIVKLATSSVANHSLLHL